MIGDEWNCFTNIVKLEITIPYDDCVNLYFINEQLTWLLMFVKRTHLLVVYICQHVLVCGHYRVNGSFKLVGHQ